MKTPVLVVHGNKDRLIDLSHAQRLFHAYGSQHKSLLIVKEGGHNNIMLTPAPTYLLQHRQSQNMLPEKY